MTVNTPGALLRAWRIQQGWTQLDLARLADVTATAVSAWELGSRVVPVDVLEIMDRAFGAGGALVDLSRSLTLQRARIGTDPDPDRLIGPRRHWGRAFAEESGPVWAWVRPGSGSSVRGFVHAGEAGYRLDADAGARGVFAVLPPPGPRAIVRVTLDAPGWVTFGRGAPPDWLDVPIAAGAALEAAELAAHEHAVIGPLASSADEHGPGRVADARALHRLMRERRGLSQADVATQASRLLGAAPASSVTAMQLSNYERGRRSRVRHLPAVLDVIYGGFGWSCFEQVAVKPLKSGRWRADFPEFWHGPVCVTLRAPGAALPAAPVAFTWSAREHEADIPAGAARLAYSLIRMPGDGPLHVSAPEGVSVSAAMGLARDGAAAPAATPA